MASAGPERYAREAGFRLEVEGHLIVVVDGQGVKQSYLEWALVNTEMTREVFDHAKALLHGSGPALEGWLALAEKKKEDER